MDQQPEAVAAKKEIRIECRCIFEKYFSGWLVILGNTFIYFFKYNSAQSLPFSNCLSLTAVFRRRSDDALVATATRGRE